MSIWNPWHGCQKISAGCQNCYVYRQDSKHDKDSSIVTKNADFDLPIRKNRKGEYKLQRDKEGIVYTCFTSDFFLDKADEWRQEAWDMIRTRSDLHFLFITKRIHRFYDCIPIDWGDGYDNVSICCTVENQDRADFRLPIFLKAPIKHKSIVCEPFLENIDLSKYLCPEIELVVVGGESGNEARICNYDWVLSIRGQCLNSQIPFHFKQTGAKFVKDGKFYRIERKFQHSQASKAKIDFKP